MGMRSIQGWRALLAGMVLGSGVLGGVLGGVAQAESLAKIPGLDGVIHACVQDNGKLRLIDPNVSECKREENPISWDQMGRQGPQGVPGAAVSGYGDVQGQTDIAAQSLGTVTVECPVGQHIISGGYEATNIASGFYHDFTVTFNSPSDRLNGTQVNAAWRVDVNNFGGSALLVHVRAVCAAIG